jgi:crotonobetainyl-CoA:carnitine CoA-transferase CaiB-like acyl-CoA transferase
VTADGATGQDSSSGPLAGIRVLDVAQIFAGPGMCAYLGDYGADVIKVEHPRGGEKVRSMGPVRDGQGLWWKVLSRNKRSLAMDLGTPEGADLLVELVKTADVLVESFRPGHFEKWGLTPERLMAANPRLIMLRVSGFGQTGPYAPRAAFGSVIEGMSGFASINGSPGGPPTIAPMALGDAATMMAGAFAIMVALHHRDQSGGPGQVIDMPLLMPLLSMMWVQVVGYDQLGILEERIGNRIPYSAPRNVYRTADDKYVVTSCSTLDTSRRAMLMIGRQDIADEPWFQVAATRTLGEHGDLIDAAFADWVQQRSRAEVMATSEQCKVPMGPIFDAADIVNDPHIVGTGMLTEVPDPDFGQIKMVSPFGRMSVSPGRIRSSGPALGAHSDEVLIDVLGLSAERVAELRDKGVVA